MKAIDPIDALLAELSRLDVRLTPTTDGGLKFRAPRGALTLELAARLRTCKTDLLLRLTAKATGLSKATVERAFATQADAETIDTDDPSGEAEAIEPSAWNGCLKCGSLDAWLACAGDRFGRTPGRWRCSTCDPPEASRRFLELAARIRADEARRRKRNPATGEGG